MKYPSDLRAGDRAATHRKLHRRRSVFPPALYVTRPKGVFPPRPFSARAMCLSIVRFIANVLGELWKLGTLVGTRCSECWFKVEMANAFAGKNHLFSGSPHGDGLEATV